MQVTVTLNIEDFHYVLGKLEDDADGIAFQYEKCFLVSGLQVSPFAMPLSPTVKRLSYNPFRGLPGFIADSLPDGWGNLLLDRQLQKQGRRLALVSPLERLCWVGANGMGALEYEPATDEIEGFDPDVIHLDSLAKDIDSILIEQNSGEALATLKSLNGSSGGARPKIICLVSSDFKKLSRGSLVNGSMTPWMIKFRSSDDRRDQGIQEYIASLVARQAGIRMPRTHLFTADNDAWFGIERFDRNERGKVHMCTAAALLECDFRIPCLDYSHILTLTAKLTSVADVLEQFRRAIFNYSISNCDDHAKNFSFLMDAKGRWSVSPAYDLVTSPALGGEHMTSVCGLGKGVKRRDFLELASQFRIDRSEATAILDEVADAVAGYGVLAKEFDVGVPKGVRPI